MLERKVFKFDPSVTDNNFCLSMLCLSVLYLYEEVKIQLIILVILHTAFLHWHRWSAKFRIRFYGFMKLKKSHAMMVNLKEHNKEDVGG